MIAFSSSNTAFLLSVSGYTFWAFSGVSVFFFFFMGGHLSYSAYLRTYLSTVPHIRDGRSLAVYDTDDTITIFYVVNEKN